MSDADSVQTLPPQAVLMQMSVGYFVPFLLRVAAQLCLADHLADGARTADQLASVTHAHAPSLYRLLRTLACNGLVSEDASHRFSLTPLGEPLRSNVPGSVRTSILAITGDPFITSWSKLLHSVQTGQAAFDKYFGVSYFDHLTANPEEAAMFSDLLIGINSADAPAVAAAYDFSSYSRIADIGGATGHLLATVLASHHGPRGTLFDLPHNKAGAEELIESRGMADRIAFVPGNFFENVPAGCDLYLLSHVLHDWSEGQCLTHSRQLSPRDVPGQPPAHRRSGAVRRQRLSSGQDARHDDAHDDLGAGAHGTRVPRASRKESFQADARYSHTVSREHRGSHAGLISGVCRRSTARLPTREPADVVGKRSWDAAAEGELPLLAGD